VKAVVLEGKCPDERVKLYTERGEILCQYYPPIIRTTASVAVIYVTGVGGGWGTPAMGLYQGYVLLLPGSELMDYVSAIDILMIC